MTNTEPTPDGQEAPDLFGPPPLLARDPEMLPGELPRGGEIPDDLDPLADGILMRHQAEWLEDKSDLKIAEKGRRTGITFAEALDDTLIAAAARSAGGDNVFYIGDTKDKGREFIGYVAHFAKTVADELAAIEEFPLRGSARRWHHAPHLGLPHPLRLRLPCRGALVQAGEHSRPAGRRRHRRSGLSPGRARRPRCGQRAADLGRQDPCDLHP